MIAPGRRCFDVQVPLREMEAFSSVNAAELLGEVKGMVKADRVSGGGGGGGGGAAAVHVVYIFSSCLTCVCVVSERFFSVFHGSCSSHGVWHPKAAWYLESTFSHSLESEKSYHINLSNAHRQPLHTRSRLHTTPMYVLGAIVCRGRPLTRSIRHRPRLHCLSVAAVERRALYRVFGAGSTIKLHSCLRPCSINFRKRTSLLL